MVVGEEEEEQLEKRRSDVVGRIDQTQLIHFK